MRMLFFNADFNLNLPYLQFSKEHIYYFNEIKTAEEYLKLGVA